jgi:hypothetical protein
MKKPECPSDDLAGKAWDRIMEIAEKPALIVQAYGGVATLAIPEEQRRAGIRARCLEAAGMVEHGSEQPELAMPGISA